MSADRSVKRIDRSPMNPDRWCYELECGHEVWVTAKRKPKRLTIHCPTCKAEGKSGD